MIFVFLTVESLKEILRVFIQIKVTGHTFFSIVGTDRFSAFCVMDFVIVCWK